MLAPRKKTSGVRPCERSLTPTLGCICPYAYAHWDRMPLIMASGVEGNLPVFRDDPRRERGGGRNYVTLDAGDKHDVLGPVPGGCAGNESRMREIRCATRGNGYT